MLHRSYGRLHLKMGEWLSATVMKGLTFKLPELIQLTGTASVTGATGATGQRGWAIALPKGVAAVNADMIAVARHFKREHVGWAAGVSMAADEAALGK
jgi:hypothetical protein